MDARRPVILVAAAACCAACGCSVIETVEGTGAARRAIRRGEEAHEQGDYIEAFAAYREADRRLSAARAAGYTMMVPASEIEALRSLMERLEEDAGSEGYVRFGDRFVGEEGLGRALADELAAIFRARQVRHFSHGRVVPESMEAAAANAPDGAFDIALSVTIRDVDDPSTFPQDAWSLVRFLLEGAFGHGFSHRYEPMFELRPWLGRQAAWGLSARPGADNRPIGLKGRIDRLSIGVHRGRRREVSGPRHGPFGFEATDAIGPYWQREHYRTYIMRGEEAERLNWERADRIPDATILGLITMGDGGEPSREGETE
ncbi:MAG: hypothetical protein PHN82_09185 [bacterium]|nr:hypothetical protein [bacterium]